MKELIPALLIIFSLISVSYGQNNVIRDELTVLESEVVKLQKIHTTLADSLSLIQSKIDSLNEVITSIRFDKLKDKTTIYTIKSDASLYEEKLVVSEVIDEIPEGSEVVFLEVDDSNFIKVKYRGKEGYVHILNFEDRDTLERLISEYRKRENEKKEDQRAYIDSLIASIEQDERWVKSFKANVRSKPNGEILTQFDQGKVIYVQDQKNGWLKFKYLEHEGHRNRITNKEDIEHLYKEGWIHSSLTSNSFVRELYSFEIRRKEFVQKNPSIRDQYKEDILVGKIRIGMTKEMVRASWGSPKDINRTVTAFSIREQWVYGGLSGRRYVYFRDGLMTSFQD